jgi:hypothetical protein
VLRWIGGFLSTPSDLVRFGMAMSTGTMLHDRDRDNAADITAPGLWRRNRLRSWLGRRDGSARGQASPAVGHDGEFGMGGSTSLIMFREQGSSWP